jgi:hypothetical protein
LQNLLSDINYIHVFVEGRIRLQILSILILFNNGEATVFISDGRTETPIPDALNGKGTIIK